MFEGCIVRPVTEADLPMVLAWRNHPNVRRYMFTQHEITLDEHRKWFARVQHDKTRQLLIVQDANDPIGFVQLNPVKPGGIADWGFYAHPDAPKGSGLRLGWAALNHAFKVLSLHKVCGQAIETNVASIAFHKKLGFSQEGVLRDQQKIGDKYQTLICFGLLAEDWLPEKLYQEKSYASN